MYDEDVMMLASGNFEREIKQSFMIFIFFYKNSCDKCNKVFMLNFPKISIIHFTLR